MFNQSIINTKVTFATVLAIVALGASLFIFHIPPAQAQVNTTGKTESPVSKAVTTSDLQTLIATLQNQLREINSVIGTTTPSFKVGMGVEITDSLRIRSSASINGTFIGVQKPGVKGVVIEGPIKQGGYNWVKVDYESGPDGWNAASWLKQHTSSAKSAATTSFNVSVANLNATVSFTLSNGCGGYVINWGDDTKTELAGAANGSPCTMAIVNVTRDHTYATAGTYTIKVERFNGTALRDESTKEIKVGSVTKPTTPADTRCVSGIITYGEGTKMQTISVNGETKRIADAAFVCRKGGWVIEGSLPNVATTTRPATTTPGVTGCMNGIVKYTEGAKLQSITSNGVTQRINDASFVCRNGKWMIEGSLPNPIATTTYTNLDVLSITKQVVVGNRMIADSGYTLYTITLKTGRVIEVKVFGLMLSSMVEAEFKKTGYTGSVSDLLSRATLVPTVIKPVTQTSVGSTSTSTRYGSVRGASTDIMTEISLTLTTIQNIIAELK